MITPTPHVPQHVINEPDADLPHRLTRRHFLPQKTSLEGSKGPRPTKKRTVCYAKGIKTKKGGPMKTVYACCCGPSNPGLHPDLCFELYHTVLDYSNHGQ